MTTRRRGEPVDGGVVVVAWVITIVLAFLGIVALAAILWILQ